MLKIYSYSQNFYLALFKNFIIYANQKILNLYTNNHVVYGLLMYNIFIFLVDLPAAEPRTKDEVNEMNLPDYKEILKKSFLFFEAQRYVTKVYHYKKK